MPVSLTGRLLVASPALDEPTFHRTVILMLAHNEEGALGVVLNRPTPAPVAEMLPGWEALAAEPPMVFTGGPVAPASVICLGELAGGGAAAGGPGGPGAEPLVEPAVEPVVEGLTTVDLTQPPSSVVPSVSRVRIFAGYSGWGADQLEGELEEGSWIVVDRAAGDAMAPDADAQWREVLRRAGGRAALYARAPDHLWLN
ncbi:MAG TPA: YqgE/AlgH family protein [Acidimicrobiales bacterium]|nr:YqgE/AlgH family protein [Acidimicrobiales bacterium]